MKYKVVALGGTFDHFHAGHRAFLEYAASLSEHLIIGLTKPVMTLHKDLPEQLETYEVRAEVVADFCRNQNISCEITALTDVYGPTLEDSRVEALCVTPETVHGAEAINSQRKLLGLSILPVEEAPLLYDEVDKIISSKRIRKGEINRQGTVYKKVFDNTIKLSEEQRSYFSKLHGTIISTPTKTDATVFICLVGDSTFETFVENNWDYTLAVIDFKKKRIVYEPTPQVRNLIEVTVQNPAGTITRELTAGIESAVATKVKHLLVDGEEDLAAVAAILLLPLGSFVYYGQPDVGIVETIVAETIKEQFYEVLRLKD